mgnify:CR=1 FL=1
MPKKTLLILLLLIISVPVIFFSFGRNGSNREISKDIAYQNGKYISIKNNTIVIEIAKTLAEQQKGLSERSFLAENNGMLFPYNKKTIPNFWMKKMLIPIDIIWIADNKIIDGVVNGAAKIIDVVSINIRKLQTGVAQFYALVMMLGIAAAFFWIILSL